MEFFNKKEDVIDLKLTQFGRSLLGKGKLKPAYYAFFDDNIIYASEKMVVTGSDSFQGSSDSGLTELQNESQERIKSTPTVRHQISFTSLEKDFQSVKEYYEENPDVEFEKNSEKNYLLPSPLGTMNPNTGYVPAWSVVAFNGAISGSSSTLQIAGTQGSYNINIPQLSALMTVDMLETSADLQGGEIDDDLFLTDLSEFQQSLGVVEENDVYLLLKIDENNSFFQKKNFDIEVFEIEQEILLQPIGPDKLLDTSIRPLVFAPLASSIDEDLVNIQDQYAEYYFDILVDDEIDDEIICKFDGARQKVGVFADTNKLDCNEVEARTPEVLFDIYTDEEDFPEEPC